MFDLLAKSLMIAARAGGINRRLESDLERRSLDEYFWHGRKWHQPEGDRR